jgi:hypothetical protein
MALATAPIRATMHAAKRRGGAFEACVAEDRKVSFRPARGRRVFDVSEPEVS